MDILYVMALDSEYGPHLRTRFSPVLTGVGPVEAAVVMARVLSEREGHLPDLVVSLGSAGSRSLEQGAVYQALSVSYRDMDATALGFPKGQTPLLDQPPTIPLYPPVPGLRTATLSSGGNVVSGAAYDLIAEDMVDMETYALKRACQHYGVPLLALRGISDGKAELRSLSDWTQYLHVVDENLAAAVDRVRVYFGSP